jgi:D-proline reductase (dithiol) PrdB
VGLIARAAEEAGIPTVSMSSAYDLTSLVKPPRTFFVNYPLGHTTGKPFDRQNQRDIIYAALTGAKDITVGGTIVALPCRWENFPPEA